jgi:CheY-like chemotaxis protein
MGLGLSLTRSLLELQGGSVEAASGGLGQGSTFTVLLPLLEPSAAGEPPVPANPAVEPPPRFRAEEKPLTTLRLLLVDDDLPTREAISAALSNYGADVRASASASDALKTLQTFTPHVILSDIAMPEVDGYTFLRNLRAAGSPHIRMVPAIAFSAFAGPDVAKASLDSGFQRSLTKPVDMELLVHAIQEVSGREPRTLTC